ncbi:MAG: STM4014 family protein [Gordonia sp. (in: high G+C Gram-positive bacteria)]|uniref:STM4014 family protein n=1 Tax=Gordonia sp. (in: high G+C Gram-positive bacteria) TaxID=84139 RepID=UPI0039E3BFB1
MNETTIAVVGNRNRRVDMFVRACDDAGVRARPITWTEVLDDPENGVWRARLAGCAAVRIDSPGEDPAVDARLRGGPVLATGEFGDKAAWHTGFVQAVRRIEHAASDAGTRTTLRADDVAVLFDKAATHRRLAAAGAPVPPALSAPVESWDELAEAVADRGWRRVFAKPVRGSSAAGVVALTLDGRGRVAATAHVALVDGRPVADLRPHRYRDVDAARLIDALGPQRLHVERWFPKAHLPDGRTFDLRVLVIAGRPTHVVVRTSYGPITNLHLGNARGDLARVRGLLGAETVDRALDVAGAAAGVFDSCLQVGVDVMLGADGTIAVAEANAFGDLLPRVPALHAPHRDTYAEQVAVLAARAAA